MMNWTLLRTNPQSQDKYVDHVRDTYPDIETYYPVYSRLTRPARKRHVIAVTQPVYPGYIFACIDTDSRVVRLLASCPIRAWFVRFGGEIGVVPGRVVTELRRLESLNQLVKEQVKHHPYRPGRAVIVHTPMYDINAVIVRVMGGNRVVVDTPLGEAVVRLHSVTVV